MVIRYLDTLPAEERRSLQNKLWESQRHVCFICEELIDLFLHKDALDIDHIEPTSGGGKDDPSNFALTHSSCNRSKQASDLRVARVLARFDRIKTKHAQAGPNRPNLSDVLGEFDGAKYELPVRFDGGVLNYSLPDLGTNAVTESALMKDDLTGIQYFFAKLPIEYLHHDSRINPRGIGGYFGQLVEEFFKRRPQLHVSLAWIKTDGTGSRAKVQVFDGQHKAAAQVMLGVRALPLRVFVNPDLDLLLTTNTNAGTTLRQVAFDKAVQRHLGSTLYLERIRRFQAATGRDPDDFSFSEKDLLDFYRGERREVKRYILDNVRNGITHHRENRLKDLIDLGGEGDRPLSYSNIERTFYSLFIYQEVLEDPIGSKFDVGENPRQLESEQIVGLMNILAEEVFIDKFDPDLGTYRVEERLRRGETIPEGHLRAFRMSREEILYNCLTVVRTVVLQFFLLQSKLIDQSRLFQYKFPEPLWESVRRVVRNLAKLPIWINKSLSETVFGGKRTYEYWQRIFETGRTPGPESMQVMSGGINLQELLRD